MGLRVPMSGFCIETWSGRFLDLSDPHAVSINREDIVMGLSNCCRFAGQSRRFYSVAEHSVLVADLVKNLGGDEPEQWAGLMHDAGEAFYHDLTAPLKYHLRSESTVYDDATRAVDAAIRNRFSVPGFTLGGTDAIVGLCDLWAFVIEAQSLLASGGVGYNVPEEVEKLGGLPSGVMWAAGLTPDHAQILFRNRWDGLFS